jgi:hypothetical protein
MTTRTAVKTRWVPGTKMQRQNRSRLRVVNKSFTAPDDASIDQLLACYGYLVEKNYLWLAGFYPRHELEAAAERIRRKLAEGRASGLPGNTLVSSA